MAGSGMKGLAKDTAIYGLSSIIGRALNWLIVPFHMYVFTDPAEYGRVSHLYGYTALFMVLLTYGMETGFFRYMNKKDEDPQKVYSTILISLGTTSILFLALCFGFIGQISNALKTPDHPDFVLMMAAVVALDAFMSIPFAHLRYKKRPIRFATLKFVFIFLNIFFNLFFLLICPNIYRSHPELINWFYDPNYGIGYVFLANLISTITASVFLLPELMGFKYTWNAALMKKILRYSFPLLILGLAGVINQTVAQLTYPIIFKDPTEAFNQLGIYSACLKITVIITMFTQAFRYAYEPFIFAQNKEQGSGEDSRKPYALAMKYFIIFALLVFLAVMFYVDLLKYVNRFKEYTVGLDIMPIAMLGEIFFGIYFNLSVWYKLTDNTRFGAWFSILGCIITVIFNLVFVPIIGYIASAWATFFCNLTIMTISYLFGQKYFPIKYDLKKIFMYFALTAIIYIAAMYPEIDNVVLRITYRTILLIAFGAVIIRKDLPLSEIPIIGRKFKKKN